MAKPLLCLSLVLLLVAPAHADPIDDLTQVFVATVESPTQTLTFFQGLANLGDLDLSGDALTDAVISSEIDQANGMLGAFVSGMQRIVKDGDRVRILRDKSVTLTTPNGAVRIPKEARFRLRSTGDRAVKLDKMEGAKAGKTANDLYPLRWLELSVDDADTTTARLNAGYGMGFNRTATIVLARPTPAAGGVVANIPN